MPTIYTKLEEIFHMVSHIVGAVLGVVALVLCIVFSSMTGDVYKIVSSIIFGLSMIALYTMSSVYHGLPKDTKAKKIFQIIDHCTIFILIAGTYTPFALCTLREYDAKLGWTIFAFVWITGIVGLILNAIDLKKYEKFSLVCYIAMGWCIVWKASLLPKLLTPTGFILVLLGGIAYTIGAVFYVLGKKKKWMHLVFHIACVIGSLLHLLSIIFYVIF